MLSIRPVQWIIASCLMLALAISIACGGAPTDPKDDERASNSAVTATGSGSGTSIGRLYCPFPDDGNYTNAWGAAASCCVGEPAGSPPLASCVSDWCVTQCKEDCKGAFFYSWCYSTCYGECRNGVNCSC
jgi:hypothetical protein